MTYNPFTLSGKTILVTGASSGIGKAIAVECSKMGATIIATGRNEERLNETLGQMVGEGHIAIGADLSEEEGITHLINKLPKIDGMVLAAGIVEMLPISFASRKKFDKIFGTNLFSPAEIIRLVTKKKLFNPGLSIVAVDSVAGSTDIAPANSIYGSGKAALKAFIKYVALEMASKNIRANTISPGMILTPMHSGGAVDDEKLQQTINGIPLKRWGTPEDIANCAIYLLSDASSYLTGTDIVIDGGYTL